MEELFFFDDVPKSEYQQWESDIKKAIIINNKSTMENSEMTEDTFVIEESKQDAATTKTEKKSCILRAGAGFVWSIRNC